MIAIKIVENQPGSTDDDPQILNLTYPSLFDQVEYLWDGVKIEIGVRSKIEPKTKAHIQSIVSKEIEIISEEPIEVTVIDPRKTFLEKLFLLHEEFQQPDLAAENAIRMSRHLYDIHALTKTPVKDEAISDHELYNSIIQHRSLYSKISGIDYSTHSRNTISFIPPAFVMNAYYQDYQKMKEQMIYGDPPEFNALISQLLDLLIQIRSSSPQQVPSEKFKQLEGNYIRWWNDDPAQAEGRVFARATIKHIEVSRLKIMVRTYIQYGKGENYGHDYSTDKAEIWEGDVTMENEFAGTILWMQINPANGGKGVKRITVHDKHGGISLVGEKNFGVENFPDKE